MIGDNKTIKDFLPSADLPIDCNLVIKFKYEKEEQQFPFYAEQITANESYNRRDLIRTKVMNGTETVTQGDWIGREFSFTTHLPVGEDRTIYDKYFLSMLHQPCTIINEDMGEMFTAQVIIKKEPVEKHPNTLKLEVEIKEIPEIDDYWIDNVLQKENRQKVVEE